MIKPNALKGGDIVGVIAPSDAVDRKGVKTSSKIIESWGLKVKWGKHVFASVGDFMAGTAEERMEDLKNMIYDPQIKAIWAASGGYAATEVLGVFDRETIDHLKTNPKWFIGYSDICLILNVLTSFGMVSLTGPGVWGLSDWDKYSQELTRKILFGEEVFGIDSKAKWKVGVKGVAEGQILYNDLQTLIYSFGTRFDPVMYGRGEIILVLEELDLDKSTLQRQIDIVFSHKRASRIKGLVVGRLVNIGEISYPKWGKKLSPQDVVMGRVKKMGIPVAFCDDLGHLEDGFFANHRFISLPNGIKSRLTVEDKNCQLQFLENICQD